MNLGRVRWTEHVQRMDEVLFMEYMYTDHA
jgi:hypothetical protein